MINKFHIFIIDENMHFMFLWFLKSSTISLFCYHYTIRQHNLEYFCIHNHHYYSITFKNHYHSCVAIFPQFFRCVQNEIIPTAWQHSKDHVTIHSRAYCIHRLKILHCSKPASVVCTEQRNCSRRNCWNFIGYSRELSNCQFIYILQVSIMINQSTKSQSTIYFTIASYCIDVIQKPNN